MRQRLRPGKRNDGLHVKKAEQEKRTILFADQSAFDLLPMAVYTAASGGKTPVLNVTLTRDHLSVMGGITPQGRFFMQMQDHSYKGPDVVRFVPLLTHEIPGQLLVMWDGASLHRCQAVKDSVRKGGAKRIHLEQLPASAPELNLQKSGTCSSGSNAQTFVVLTESTSNGKCVVRKNG